MNDRSAASKQETASGSRSPGAARTGEDIDALAGGVSSDIRIVHGADGDIVVKRALPKLRVQADWFCDPARSATEVRGLRALAELLGPTHVPRVLWCDEAKHEFAMERIAPRYLNWKQQLLAGRIDCASAHAAGILLGQLHTRSARDVRFAAEFDDRRIFVELRIKPFFERVAARNPALAAEIAAAIAQLERTRNALVHGDYSPKNLLVDGGEVVVLDCEVAHWGDARFDVAFCLAHLLLKSYRRGAPAALFHTAALRFLAGYREYGPAVLDADFVRQLGCLLLARLEGDSPVEYRDELPLADVKSFATALVREPAAVPFLSIGANA